MIGILTGNLVQEDHQEESNVWIKPLRFNVNYASSQFQGEIKKNPYLSPPSYNHYL
jgi:hypothetical protein